MKTPIALASLVGAGPPAASLRPPHQALRSRPAPGPMGRQRPRSTSGWMPGWMAGWMAGWMLRARTLGPTSTGHDASRYDDDAGPRF